MTPIPILTGPEIMREWDYRYAERIGILCGLNEPTAKDRDAARAEADAWVTDYRRQRLCLDAFECD